MEFFIDYTSYKVVSNIGCNIFGRFIETQRKFMKRGDGVDSGKYATKVARVQCAESGSSILGIAISSSENIVIGDIKLLAKSAGAGGRVTLGASGQNLNMRYVSVPPAPPWRVKKMVEFELVNKSASPDELSFAYRPLNIGSALDQGLSFITAVGKNPYLDELIDSVKQDGISTRYITPQPNALFEAFNASSLSKNDKSTLLIDIGQDNIQMALAKDGELLFARNMSGVAGGQLTQNIANILKKEPEEAERYKIKRAQLHATLESKDEKVLAVNRVLHAHAEALVNAITSGLRMAKMQTKAKDLDFDQLLLSGGGANLKGLQEFLNKRTGKPVNIFEPKNGFDLSTMPSAQKALIEERGTEFVIAIGLAVTDTSPPNKALALIPPSEIKRREFFSRAIFTYASGAAALVIALWAFMSSTAALAKTKVATKQYQQNQTLLEGRFRKLRERQKLRDTKYSQLNMLRQASGNNVLVARLMSHVQGIIPENMSISKIMIAENDGELEFMLVGVAKDTEGQEFLDQLTTLKTNMLSSGLLQEEGSRVIQVDPSRVSHRLPKASTAFSCKFILKNITEGEATNE